MHEQRASPRHYAGNAYDYEYVRRAMCLIQATDLVFPFFFSGNVANFHSGNHSPLMLKFLNYRVMPLGRPKSLTTIPLLVFFDQFPENVHAIKITESTLKTPKHNHCHSKWCRRSSLFAENVFSRRSRRWFWSKKLVIIMWIQFRHFETFFEQTYKVVDFHLNEIRPGQ